MTAEDYLNRFRYRNKIVAFIDVLGFKEAILEDYFDERRIIARMDEAFTWSINSIPLEEEGDWYSIKLFSDCLCISCEGTAKNLYKLLREVSNWHKVFFVYQRFLRGGITFGPHYESERIIFSKALIEAYNLEQKVAIYPRVLVSDSVVELLSTDEHYRQLIGRFIKTDTDGKRFVDYFKYLIAEEISAQDKKAYLLTHKNAIIHNVSRNKHSERILKKYLWAVKYHNEARYEVLNSEDYEPDEYKQIIKETEINLDIFPEGFSGMD